MKTRTSDERGMSLIEVLIATAVLAIAVVISLTVYDAARKSFKKGENAVEQQEAVRIAYDRLTADLRMLGFNANPDGAGNRPDEQLEVALDHAIVFRGDFDAEDPTARLTPETALAGGAFSSVSTGNDEVVGYVLAKPDGTGPDTITFQADVNDQPRDGAVANVTVGNVVLNPTSPPYTLYKISLNNDISTCCTGGFVVRTPVAENIRNLTIQYFDSSATGAIVAPGAAETATVKALRAGVTRFNVSLIGMTRDPDMNYNDPVDTVARTYRKFELRGDVVPRNMRMKGIQDLNADSVPPTKPATPTLIAGHCGAFIVSWAANPTADGVTQYRVNFGTSSGVVNGTRGTAGSPYYLDGLTTGTAYYISIQAQDAAGNVSVKSNEASATVANVNIPSAPTGPFASTDQVNNVRVSWTAVTTNTASVPAGDPLAPACRDLAGYRLYRGNSSSMTATNTFLRADETAVRGAGIPPWVDTPTINCHTYYYMLTAVDTCGVESTSTSVFTGRSTTTVEPQAPVNVQAFLMGANNAQVTWNSVALDVQDNPIAIDAYDVYRSSVVLKTDPPSSVVFGSIPIGTTSNSPYDDTSMPSQNATETIYYMVKAKDECVNISAPSNSAQPTCAFSGTVVLQGITEGQIVAGVVPTTVAVIGGTDTYTAAAITYVHETAGLTRAFASTAAGTSWSDNGWLASPPGNYTVTGTVTNSTGCQQSAVVHVQADSWVGCCLTMFPTTNTTLSCAGGSTKCKEVSYRIGNDRCLTAVSIVSMTVGWTDYSGNQPRWQTAKLNGSNMAAAGTWTTTYVAGTNEVGTATKSGFTPGVTTNVPYATPMTSSNTSNMTYVFDKDTDSGSGVNRLVDVFGTNTYVFTLLDSTGTPSGIQTTCNFANLTVN